ncbi:MAG: hemerythrin domain-containing protein [Polyangiaceae bacterium]
MSAVENCLPNIVSSRASFRRCRHACTRLATTTTRFGVTSCASSPSFANLRNLIHHEKEEEFLMPALVASGLRWDEGIMLRMRKEHDFERHLLQTLRHLALQAAPWSEHDRRRVVELAERFVGFMRNHIDYEDRDLYALVRGRLTAEAEATLETQLGKFDEKRIEAGEFELLQTLGRELVEHYATSV